MNQPDARKQRVAPGRVLSGHIKNQDGETCDVKESLSQILDDLDNKINQINKDKRANTRVLAQGQPHASLANERKLKSEKFEKQPFDVGQSHNINSGLFSDDKDDD